MMHNGKWIACPFFLLLLGLVLASTAACRPSFTSAAVASQRLPAGALRGRNVLLITIDTLRADRVGSYGSPAGLTPALDRLAREGLRFETVYSAVPLTLPSHASLFTAEYPTAHGVRDNGSFRLDGSRPTLATALKGGGYQTAAFVGAFVLDARFGLNRGFDLYDDYYSERPGATAFDLVERPAERVVQPALQWIRSANRPWFAWVHLYDPHEPYSPPEPYRSRYSTEPYDGEVAYADAQAGWLIDRLREGDRVSDALVIVASDHGEGLGEHGEPTHGTFAYNSTLRVPLILWLPGRIQPATFAPPARLVDVMPTLLDLIGLPAPPGLDGRSLRAAFSGETPYEEAPSYFEALNANLTRNWAPLTGLVYRGYKVIDLPIPELYDLGADPAESQNLYTRQRDLARDLEARLDRVARPVVPGKAAADPEVRARLRSLGYIVAPADRPKRTFTARDDPKTLIALGNTLDDAVTLFGSGAAREAIERVRGVIRERSDFTQAYDRLAYMLRRTGRLDDAIATLDDAARRGIADAALLSSLGVYLQEAGSLARSASVLETAVRMNPADLEAQSRLGVTYTRMGRAAEAERIFRQVLAADPSSASTYNNLGSLYLATNRPSEAIDAFTRALAFDPNLANAHNGLGVAYVRQGRLADAVEKWKIAARLDPMLFDALYNLGTALAQLRREREAIEYLEQFAATAPAARYGPEIARVRALATRLRRDRGQG